ncbi:uncharacterized protein LAESUDRAFT_695760 [Laetiporus sulphureus 93-53]|uniref:DUF221-domain-containing protein n=1 Tax=Laetiporus sulphureus 93-53 TaxID=1314785 RepID=A0A165FLC1_9APHY|nr:uncharacterized protein LAESUDRAFT_695760 [Laetiporus sulphureus 93-53]KZT09143.1 hypothetical protein LAESUDRAFT_695760 [Laetiporus sulphureus 93-53]
MATIQSRPFSKDYSGLINQSVIGGCIVLLCATAHECLKRKRRKTRRRHDPNSVECWEFRYLYQGRSWAKRSTAPHPKGWPLSWVKKVLKFPEEKMNDLRGIDATLYTRFLRGCCWFTLAQTLTTLPILLPIHVIFSDGSVSPKSMTRASISSLVGTAKGLSLLWIHLLLLVWITISWFCVLIWLCRGEFHLRVQRILAAADRANSTEAEQGESLSQYTHPHPQYPFVMTQRNHCDKSNRGIRMRTVMVTNIPPALRLEKELKEYFEYYLSRHVSKPGIGVTSTTQPGFLNKTFAFLLIKLTHIPIHLHHPRPRLHYTRSADHQQPITSVGVKPGSLDPPTIDRVVLVRRMTELSSLFERREEVLRLLETAHIKLARNVLSAVGQANVHIPVSTDSSGPDISAGEDRIQLLVRTLRPFLTQAEDIGPEPLPALRRLTLSSSWRENQMDLRVSEDPPPPSNVDADTVWDALLSLPRSSLDAYQPLIHLSSLFRGRTVPSIDYYTAKLEVLTSLITEKRAILTDDYEPMSTAFVTFIDPADARRACKSLAVHPANPLQCLVTMAPSYEDLDWTRLMKPTFRVEFVKDWLVNIGVWGFTISWVFPVSILVGLVSIQNISSFWPQLSTYLDKHPWEEEVLQSFVPTVLVSLLSLLIPLLLLLIAKKAHTIATLSTLHDRIMTRYYKFLIVNVLIFFCVGTATLQSFLVSLSSTSGLQVIQIVADSFPTAGPFYVGWLIFTTAMHGGIELALFGLPLLLYPSTKRQVTPRKRAIGIRPRTFNYYYWLPNHVLVVHVVLVFAVLNPLVIPFSFVYYCVEATVIRNQLLHVYAKNYEGNGQRILIRIIRYSCDGLILAQVVFLAYMVVLKKTVNIAVSAVLVVLTAGGKLLLTRLCRTKFERDDLLEAQIICGMGNATEALLDEVQPIENNAAEADPLKRTQQRKGSHTLPARVHPTRFPDRIDDGYATIPRRPYHRTRRGSIPFGPSQFDLMEDVQEVKAVSGSSPIIDDGREYGFNGKADVLVSERALTSKPVTPHPPHPAWDDESSPDVPYDNPYYIRPIHDELWLPRDPLGPLDLDDTVNVHLCLTTQPGSGRLGAWREDEYIASGVSSILISRGSAGGTGVRAYNAMAPLRRLNGNEKIELPPEIESRLQTLDREGDAEVGMASWPPHRQHGWRQWSSSGRYSSLELGLGDPIVPGRNASRGLRSTLRHGLPSSFFTFPRHLRQVRFDSAEEEMDTRQGGHLAPAVPDGLPVTDAGMSAVGGVVSLREAVVGEVIVEEEAMQDRLRYEEAEEERIEEPRSWWASWVFAGGQ